MSPSNRKTYRASAAALALIVLAALTGWVSGAAVERSEIKPVAPPHQAAQTAATKTTATQPQVAQAQAISTTFRAAAQEALPSVVSIHVTSTEKAAPQDESSLENQFQDTPFGDMFKNPMFRRFFDESPSMPRSQMSAGSGVIIDPSGIIVTNNHVVASGGHVVVLLHDGREFPAAKVATDPQTDLAVIWIKGAGTLDAAHWGNSDNEQIGDWVLALGEPFGLRDTVTAGIISAKDRGLGMSPREDFLQTDAAINPGNSGGPLVNLQGQVIGINTAISTESGSFAGVGFAVPSNLAKWVTDELIHSGKVSRVYLGVAIQQLTPELAQQFGLTSDHGAVVTQVMANSPAAKAGLKDGDVILTFNGQQVTDGRHLQALVEQTKVGATVAVELMRGDKRMSIDVAVQQQPAKFGLAANSPAQAENPNAAQEAFKDLGLTVEPLTADMAQQLGFKGASGVVISAVDSGGMADLAGLAPQMVVTQVDRQPVKTVADFRAAIKKGSLSKGILLLVRSRQGSEFVVLRAQGST